MTHSTSDTRYDLNDNNFLLEEEPMKAKPIRCSSSTKSLTKPPFNQEQKTEVLGKGSSPLLRQSSSDSESEISQNDGQRKAIFRQILATCAVLLLTTGVGCPVGYSAIFLPQVYNSTDPLQMDIDMASWFTSIHSLAGPVGAFISGPIMTKFGRRPCLMFSTLPVILCWVIIATATNHWSLLIGRFLGGMSTGLMGAASQVWTAEIASPSVRGILIGLPLVTYSVGILIVYFLGSFLHWRTVAWISMILPIIALVSLYLAPESPVWLTQNGKIKKASSTLVWLRGNTAAGEKELKDLLNRFEQQKDAGTQVDGFCKTITTVASLKPLFIVNAFYILQVLSGSYLVVFYAVDIIQDFQSQQIDALTAAVYTALMRMGFCAMYCFLVAKMPRRPLSIMCTGGSGVAAGVLAIYLYVRANETKTAMDVFISGICIFFYLAFNTGLLPLPGIMTGELLPARVRSQMAAYIFCLFSLILFGSAKIFPYFKECLKIHGVFALFSISSFFATLLSYLLLPETKHMTLGEIEDYFRDQKWLWSKRALKDTETSKGEC